MLDPSWVNDNMVSAGTLLNILTWQQLQGNEIYSTMMPAVEDYYTLKKTLWDELLNDPNHK